MNARPLLARLAVAVLAVLPGAAPLHAQTQDDLYSATVIVTGTDMRSRPNGFARALDEVLVKLAGVPDLPADPRLRPLEASADKYVASFTYVDQMAGRKVHDDQGTYDRSYNLTVRFDPARIDAALAGLGEKPWRGVRPVIVPVLSVLDRSQARYLMSADAPQAAEQRGAFAVAAGEFGLRVRIPTTAELAQWGADLDHPDAPKATLADGEVLVSGTLTWSADLPGWIGFWRLQSPSHAYAWRAIGVSYDNAFKSIARGVLRVASGHGPPQ
jgi:hypothetical protein